MSAVINFQFRLQQVECATCGIAFAMSEKFIKDRRNNHKSLSVWDSNYFAGKSEEEKLREQLAAKERDLEWERSQWRNAQADQ